MTNPEHYQQQLSRRVFATASLSALAGTTVLARAARQTAAVDRINIGVIGLGSRGFNLIDEFLSQSDCQITAVCDVDELHHRDRPWGTGKTFGRQPASQHIQTEYAAAKSGTQHRGLQVFADYRQLIDMDSLDAVVVATPDHWHALCTLTALRAGKDVYCEKPVTHLFTEGQAVIAETARQQAVFQTGSQQRSDALFQRVVDLAHNEVLGKIKSVEVGLPPGYAKPMGSTTILKPRSGLDYDLWCGPSESLPLMQARFHRWWRGHRAYGGGVLMDWIGHHNDIAHWAIGVQDTGPVSVEAVNWEFPETGIYNTPASYTIRCEYANGVTSSISSQNQQGLKIIGTQGWVYARRGKIEASDSRWLEKDFQPGSVRIPRPSNHVRNFLDCVRSRSECIAPARISHRSITPGHLGYVSSQLQKKLQWDPEKETITNDPEADRILKQLDYRNPWKLMSDA